MVGYVENEKHSVCDDFDDLEQEDDVVRNQSDLVVGVVPFVKDMAYDSEIDE